MEQKNAMNKNVRPTAPAAPQGEAKGGSAFAAIVIPLALIVSIIIYKFVFGSPGNFQGGNPENNPCPVTTSASFTRVVLSYPSC
ncbi:hypothetical protein MUN79_07705 [Hymenobacter cellulosilyticus]|uniref:Uncharacterized protein n=1 Tax=Hymenobacter cellulosilyticus TaxID=2932248 RepID=A0A8T9QD80_9BACT|nr:hypothetical protein [Hymenobacter cellulosilyticus]UOQ73790.1 hypothetical protein MUN79_07705 [Hymenobacter cellulosilyticus]